MEKYSKKELTLNENLSVLVVEALLIQKNGQLRQEDIRGILSRTATDITTGMSASGQPAGPGIDLATGSGLVNAYRAWSQTRSIQG